MSSNRRLAVVVAAVAVAAGNIAWVSGGGFQDDEAVGAAAAFAVLSVVPFLVGVVWGRMKAVLVSGLLIALPLVAADVLYFGVGVDLPGYCGEPRCDPGPLPASLVLIVLRAVLSSVALGVAARPRITRDRVLPQARR